MALVDHCVNDIRNWINLSINNSITYYENGITSRMIGSFHTEQRLEEMINIFNYVTHIFFNGLESSRIGYAIRNNFIEIAYFYAIGIDAIKLIDTGESICISSNIITYDVDDFYSNVKSVVVSRHNAIHLTDIELYFHNLLHFSAITCMFDKYKMKTHGEIIIEI